MTLVARPDQVDEHAEWLVVWVPGTFGHEMHQGFEYAVQDRLGADAAVYVVDYPASADFEDSVPAGVDALHMLLARLAIFKQPFQKIVVAGSSQGAWVIHEYAKTMPAWSNVWKAVTFGLPAMSGFEPSSREDADNLYDVRSPYDAVGWGWAGDRGRILRHVSEAASGKPWHFIPLLPYLVFNPVVTAGFIGLCLTHFKAPRLSPHDYTPAMPLAVEWLTN